MSSRGSKKAGGKQADVRKTDKNTTAPATTRSRSNRGTRVTVEVAQPSSKSTGATSTKTAKNTRQEDDDDVTMDDETARGEQVGEEERDPSSKNDDEEDIGAEGNAGEVDAEDVPRKKRPKTEEEKVRVLWHSRQRCTDCASCCIAQTADLQRKKAIKDRVTTIAASTEPVTAEGSDLIRLSKKQQDAFLGWALVDLLGPPPDKTGARSLQIQFGTWNDCTVNQGQARQLMEGMHDQLKRYDSESYLQVPVKPKDFTKDGIAKLKETKGWNINKAVEHARSGKLLSLTNVLDPKVGIIYPIGG
jgi:hypothetical protein